MAPQTSCRSTSNNTVKNRGASFVLDYMAVPEQMPVKWFIICNAACALSRWARRLALLPGLRSLSIRGGWHPALSTGLWDRRGGGQCGAVFVVVGFVYTLTTLAALWRGQMWAATSHCDRGLKLIQTVMSTGR
jgi:hypothetical protein